MPKNLPELCSGGDLYLRHGFECIHRVVTQNWVAQLRLFGSRSQSFDRISPQTDRAVKLVNNKLWINSLARDHDMPSCDL